MSRSSTLTALGTRNTFRAAGRLAVLTLLLAAALVAKSTSGLSLGTLTNEAVAVVASRGQSFDMNCTIYFPNTSFSPRMLERYISEAIGWGYWQLGDYAAGWQENYFGPGGQVVLVRPAPYINWRTGERTDPHYEKAWFSKIEGSFPVRTDQIAVPRPFATTYGIRVGDRLELVGEVATVPFDVSGIYEPLGEGVIYDYFLSAMDPSKSDVNFLAGNLDPRAMNMVRSWGRSSAGRVATANSLASQVTEITPPKTLMRDIARTVYSSQSSAMALGFGLIAGAVLTVLLVALVERRREAAIYKMVGLDGPATLRVLATELVWSLAIAVVLAAPAYWYLASRYVLDVHRGGLSVLGPPFVSSFAWTVVVAALAAFYPFALASIGTPNQLLNKQKIYLFRRKQTLRGYASFDDQ